MITKKNPVKKKATKKKVTNTTLQPKLTAQDRRWRAQDDARTLAEAEVILNDKLRLKSAKIQAKIMVRDQEKQLTSIKKVANTPKK